jgi:ribonuclease J
MLRLTQPKFFLPVHGEYNHIMKHKDTAIACGVPEKNILLMQDGDVIEVTPRNMRKIKSVKTGKVFIDNQANKHIENSVVSDRQKLANEGIIMLVLQVDESGKRFVTKPKVTTYGLVSVREEGYLSKEIEDLISLYLVNSKHTTANTRTIENDVRQTVRKHIIRKYKKYPLIVPTVFTV